MIMIIVIAIKILLETNVVLTFVIVPIPMIPNTLYTNIFSNEYFLFKSISMILYKNAH